MDTTNNHADSSKESYKDYKLKVEEELRFEVNETRSDEVTVQLKDGLAEVFGTELVCGNQYVYGPGSKFAVFTWYGCTLRVTGDPEIAYVARETPMNVYLNTHAGLEFLRKRAEKVDRRGPIVMLVGPVDVGKSTVSRILLNYATRVGRAPIYIDIDVGQGNIGIPGTIGAVLLEQPATPTGEFVQKAPLCFHFGTADLGTNPKLYKVLCGHLAAAVQKRFEANKKVKYSGAILNTAGWVKDQGYTCLIHAAACFEVDVVIVLDQERLYNSLVRDLPSFVQVVFEPKSGGVVERSKKSRFGSRMNRLRNYFYGSLSSPFYPHSFEVRFSDVKIFKIGAPVVPASCLPIGMTNEDAETKLVPVPAGKELLNHILTISYAKEENETTIAANVAGFIYVTHVDLDRQTMTVLSPQPRPLPAERILLWSDVRFIDAQ